MKYNQHDIASYSSSSSGRKNEAHASPSSESFFNDRELNYYKSDSDAPCIPQDDDRSSTSDGFLMYEPLTGCLQGDWDIATCSCRCFEGWCHYPHSTVQVVGPAGDGISPALCAVPCDTAPDEKEESGSNTPVDKVDFNVTKLCEDGKDCGGDGDEVFTLSEVPILEDNADSIATGANITADSISFGGNSILEVVMNSANNTIYLLDDYQKNNSSFSIAVISTQDSNTSVFGSCVLSPDGIFYTPPKEFTGLDECTYKICDSSDKSLCNIVTTHIRVIPSTNDEMIQLDVIDLDGQDATTSSASSYSNLTEPIVSDDVVHVPVDAVKYPISVLDNDIPIDPNHPLHIVSVSAHHADDSDRMLQYVSAIIAQASNGVCEISPDGTAIFYTPNPGFVGADQCEYRACDDTGEPNCANATVYITVSDVPTLSPSSQPSMSLLPSLQPSESLGPTITSAGPCPTSTVWWSNGSFCVSGTTVRSCSTSK